MAKIVITFHFLVVLFLVVGFPVGLKINHRGFRYFHCVILLFVTILSALDLPCPLTPLEGLFAANSGPFLETWLNKIIYPQWIDNQRLLSVNVIFAVTVISSFYWYPLKK